MRTLDENAGVAERIRFYRTKRDMNGNTLAELAGLSRFAIIAYENNQTEPALSDLKNIAAILEVEADNLFDDYYRFLDHPYTDQIKNIRKKNKLLQRELGAMLGVTRRAVERWENGKNKVTRDMWEKLNALNLL